MATFRTIANKLASDLQRDFGLTKEQAIGFVGNLAMESNGFQSLQEISPTVSGSRGGYGYAQWTGPRRTEYEAWAKANNLPVDSYDANYGFIKQELNGSESAALAALKNAETVKQAAKVTMNRYLRPGIPNSSSRLSWANKVADGYAYVPPGDLINEAIPGTEGLQGIHDRNDEARGYGELAPVPSTKSANFGGAPVTMSPALQAARQRLQLARDVKTGAASAGATTKEALAVTPRLTQANGQVTGITDTRPQLDWAQFKPGVDVAGAGSLYDERISPGALNPGQASLSAPGAGLTPAQQQAIRSTGSPQATTTVTGRPDAPIGTLPTARPSETIETTNRAGNAEPGPTTQTREPTYGTLKTGKQVEIGKSYKVGDKLMIAERGPDGTAVLTDVEKVRDNWLRQNVDPNAPLLLENSLAGSAARTIAAPMIKQGVDTAVGNVVNALGNTASSIVDAGTGAFNDIISRFGSAAKPTTSANANLTSAKAEQAAQRTATLGKSSSSSPSGSALSAPGAGLTQSQKDAISAVPLASYVKPLVSSGGNALTTSKPALVATTVANPEYASWVEKYGDGSQVQTAATGGMITKDQLAAIQNVNGAVQAPIVKTPPAPPKTITVMKPGNALPTTTTAPAPQTIQGGSTGKAYTVGQNYTSGGYIYTANADGSFSKIGRIGSSPSDSYNLANQTARAKASQSIGGSAASGSSSGNLGGVSSSGRRYDYDNNVWV